MQFNRVISLIVIVKGLIILHHPTLKDRSINYLLLLVNHLNGNHWKRFIKIIINLITNYDFFSNSV